MTMRALFTEEQMTIIAFCAAECSHQHSGERSVFHLISAWEYAFRNSSHLPTEGDILILGRIVEPGKNPNGYRNTPVMASGNVLLAPRLIHQAMRSLMGSIDDLSPEEFTKEYLEIHPFIDGNGRSALILFNWIRRTLMAPSFAPDFWGSKSEGIRT